MILKIKILKYEYSLFSYFLIIFLINFTVYSQNKYSVLDNETEEVVSFASVNFLNGFGMFSNENGEFEIEDESLDYIEISHLNYQTKKVHLPSQTNKIIYLEKNNIVLEEVSISNQKTKKRKKKKFKSKANNQNIHSSATLATSGRSVFLKINLNKNDEIYYVDKISINTVTEKNQLSLFEVDKTISVLIKYNIHENIDGIPSMPIQQDEYVCIKGKDLFKNIEIKFKDEIKIEEEGIFISITYLGQTDKECNLLNNTPYTIVKKNNEYIKFFNSIPVFLPLVETADEPTLQTNIFSTNEIKRILPETSAPLELNKEEREKYISEMHNKYPNYSVPFEFTYYHYE